jgi:hypothetical protein
MICKLYGIRDLSGCGSQTRTDDFLAYEAGEIAASLSRNKVN